MMLCEYELQVLRDIINHNPREWGAATGQALEALRGSGCLNNFNDPTPKGRALIELLDCPDCAVTMAFGPELCTRHAGNT